MKTYSFFSVLPYLEWTTSKEAKFIHFSPEAKCTQVMNHCYEDGEAESTVILLLYQVETMKVFQPDTVRSHETRN